MHDREEPLARSLIAPETVIRKSPRAAFHPLAKGEGGVLLHVDSGAYHGVNRVGALIWELLERPIPFRDLLNALSGQFSDAPAAMADEVNAFLTDLHARDLVEIVPEDRQT